MSDTVGLCWSLIANAVFCAIVVFCVIDVDVISLPRILIHPWAHDNKVLITNFVSVNCFCAVKIFELDDIEHSSSYISMIFESIPTCDSLER